MLALGACGDDDNNEPQDPVPTTTLAPATTTIRVADLPAPDTSISVTNYPQVLMERPAAATLRVPADYAVNIFQENLPSGR